MKQELAGGRQEQEQEAGRGSFRGKGGRESSHGYWFGSDSVSEKNFQVLGLGHTVQGNCWSFGGQR